MSGELNSNGVAVHVYYHNPQCSFCTKYAKKMFPQEILAIPIEISLNLVFPPLLLCLGSCREALRFTPQKLQNRTARVVTNSSYDAPADALIHKLKWPACSNSIFFSYLMLHSTHSFIACFSTVHCHHVLSTNITLTFHCVRSNFTQ